MALELNPQPNHHDRVAPVPAFSAPLDPVAPQIPRVSLGGLLWQARWFIALVMAIMFVLGCVLLQVLPATYTSAMTLAPPDSGNNSAAASAGQDLAASFGISIPSAASDEQDVAIEQLTSYAVAQRLSDTRQDLVHNLFRKRWSGTAWIIPDDAMTTVQNTLARWIVGRPLLDTPQPSPYEIMNALIKRVDVKRNRDNNIVDVSFDDTDPGYAHDFLEAIFTISQSIIRDRRSAESNARMNYIRTALDKVTVAEYRDTLVKLMSAEEQNLMIIAAGSDIGIRIIDRPYVATAPSGPKAIIVLLGMVMVGLLLGIVFVTLRTRRQARRRAARGY